MRLLFDMPFEELWNIDQTKDVYQEIKEYFRHHDPMNEREDDVFMQLGYIDVQHLCPRIRAEVFMAVGLMDTVCPPSTQFAAYNKIPSKKGFDVYPDFWHERLSGREDRVFQFMSEL